MVRLNYGPNCYSFIDIIKEKTSNGQRNSAAEFRKRAERCSLFSSLRFRLRKTRGNQRPISLHRRSHFPQSKLGIGTIYQRENNKSMTPSENYDSRMNVAAERSARARQGGNFIFGATSSPMRGRQ